MQLKKRHAIALTVIALILCVVQAGIWIKSTYHVGSQTAEMDKESQHSPTEIPGVAGFSLLVLAGVLVSTPETPFSE